MDHPAIYKSFKTSIFEILDSKFKKAEIKRNFHFIRFNNEIRWVVEHDNSTINVLKNWRPYNFLNFLYWRILIIFKKLKIINFLPFTQDKILNISEDFLNINNNLDFKKITFAFYITRNDHPHRKSIIFLINKETQKCCYVIKRALTEISWKSIKNEYKVLKQLEIDNNKYVPKVIGLDLSNKAFFQEFIDGEPASLNFENVHYKFLASLINKNKFINLPKIKSFINDFYSNNIDFIDNKKFLGQLDRVLSLSIWDKNIQSVRVHGDFVPWNLKKSENNLFVYDWEYSIESFLPFYDLIYYKFYVEKNLKKRISINTYEYLDALNSRGYNLSKKNIKDLYLISKVYILIQSKLY